MSGLSGTVVLQDNGGDDLSVSANGAFTFATALAGGAAYGVTVKTNPAGQTCSVPTGRARSARPTSPTWPSPARDDAARRARMISTGRMAAWGRTGPMSAMAGWRSCRRRWRGPPARGSRVTSGPAESYTG